MGGECQDSQAVEEYAVDHSIRHVFRGQQHDEGDNEICIKHQEPGDKGTDHATAILNEPHMGSDFPH